MNLPYFQSSDGTLNLLQTKWASILNPLLAAMSSGASVPSGAIFAFAGTSAPNGYLLCDGSTYSQNAYPTLFAAIGTTYGGSGTLFQVPNSQGVFLRGAGTQTIGSVDYTGAQGTTQADQIQGHEHTIAYSVGASLTSGPENYVLIGGNVDSATGTPISDGTNGTPRTGIETRPVNISVLYIIKT